MDKSEEEKEFFSMNELILKLSREFFFFFQILLFGESKIRRFKNEFNYRR